MIDILEGKNAYLVALTLSDTAKGLVQPVPFISGTVQGILQVSQVPGEPQYEHALL